MWQHKRNWRAWGSTSCVATLRTAVRAPSFMLAQIPCTSRGGALRVSMSQALETKTRNRNPTKGFTCFIGVPSCLQVLTMPEKEAATSEPARTKDHTTRSREGQSPTPLAAARHRDSHCEVLQRQWQVAGQLEPGPSRQPSRCPTQHRPLPCAWIWVVA
jgi:hypothetical protein